MSEIRELLLNKKEVYLELVKNKNRIVLMNKKFKNGVRILCFVWNDKTISPKTDRFLILTYEIIGSTIYIAFKHLRGKPIIRWDKCGLPAVDVQEKISRFIDIPCRQLHCIGL